MINEKSLERFNDDEFHTWRDKTLTKYLEKLAKRVKGSKGKFGSAKYDFIDLNELKRGEFVPFVFVGVVSTDALLDGGEVKLIYQDGEPPFDDWVIKAME